MEINNDFKNDCHLRLTDVNIQESYSVTLAI